MACDQCERWVHQICGLFNKGRNTQDTHYMCPMCLQKGGPSTSFVSKFHLAMLVSLQLSRLSQQQCALHVHHGLPSSVCCVLLSYMLLRGGARLTMPLPCISTLEGSTLALQPVSGGPDAHHLTAGSCRAGRGRQALERQ